MTLAGCEPSASANDACPPEVSKSIDAARKALAKNDPAHDRAALACLVEVVAALDAKLEALRDGSARFTGPIMLPKTSESSAGAE